MALPSSSPPATAPRLDSVLSFTLTHDDDDAHQDAAAYDHHAEDNAASDASSDDSDFEFAFAPPLGGVGAASASLADDLFSHGRIVPAYPVLDRSLPPPAATTAPPSPDTYCAWVPRSAPGSPAQAAIPKSASTGQATSSARRWRLRDLLSTSDRSHSDGKEKFVFLQPPANAKTSPAAAASNEKQSKKQSTSTGTSGSKKKSAAAVTEMDMATAHRLFYGKPAGAATAGHHQQPSYLPYRPGIVGFFATAHALRRSHHHPY